MKRKRVRVIAIPAQPSSEALSALRREISRKVRKPGNVGDAYDRKVSNAFAAELRARGWLHEEGYAPGSWAAP